MDLITSILISGIFYLHCFTSGTTKYVVTVFVIDMINGSKLAVFLQNFLGGAKADEKDKNKILKEVMRHKIQSEEENTVTPAEDNYLNDIHPGITSEQLALHPKCPQRNMFVPETWRQGKEPNYDAVNKKYLLQRTHDHDVDSLAKIVENLVKTWEAEASHVRDPAQWSTIDFDNWSLNANNNKAFGPIEASEVGNYNVLFNGIQDKSLYDNEQGWEESHHKFRGVFKTGFAWEVLEVHTGPPNVRFTWRHWGHVGSNTLEEEQNGIGDLIEMKGYAVATVNEKLELQEVKTYFDDAGWLQQLDELMQKNGIENISGSE